MPVLNIPREDFALKTELVAALQQEGVTEQCLVFRDELDLGHIENLELILVDHNVLAEDDRRHEDKVVEVIDHHVHETSCENAVIEMVGSCSSLVLRQIWKENPDFRDASSLRLIHATILVDTVLLKPEAKKVTAVDVEMVEKCEAILQNSNSRDDIFNQLNDVKRKVDHLNAKQLLRRDFKTLATSSEEKICLSSVPMLAKDWAALPDVLEHVSNFSSDGNFSFVLVLGSFFKDDKPIRDLILIGDHSSPLLQRVAGALENTTEPCLQLKEMSPFEQKTFRGYNQGNAAASRKQIMPIVKSALSL